MWSLRLRMWLLTTILFAIIYAVVSIISYSLGVGNFYFYLILSFVMMFLQYMMGPKIVEWSMKVRYLKEGEDPKLEAMVKELAKGAGVPTPRIGVADISIPNAFAFGRTIRDGRICVTEGIRRLLDDRELKAVIGHEMSHIKNRDMLTITLLSVIPIILYRIAWQLMFYGDRRDRNQGSAALIGFAAFAFYFLTNLLVLYASRIREYFADSGSISLGSEPSSLASALYKLAYGSARMPKEAIKDAEGMKAFFVNDPSRSISDLKELKELDLDRSGSISAGELHNLQSKRIVLSFGDKVFELFSTHPNMLKRIKRLSAI